MSKILYTVARNVIGDLVFAVNAEKGQSYQCPVCNNELILRKSGKTGPRSKRPHFAHHHLTENCTPETALHYAFKNLLAERITASINKKEAVPFSWDCTHCEETHSGNLLKKAIAVKVEHHFGICKPDIALMGKGDSIVAVIEIVVTHKPEENARNYYKQNNIIVIEIHLDSDQDLERLEQKLTHPDIVDFCINPTCKKCNRHQHRTILTIANGSCWKCKEDMKVAFIRMAYSTFGPENCNVQQRDLARKHGAILTTHYSAMARTSYLANSCGKCNAFVGDYYLFSDYAAPASYGTIPSQNFHIGYHCESCESDGMYGDNQ